MHESLLFSLPFFSHFLHFNEYVDLIVFYLFKTLDTKSLWIAYVYIIRLWSFKIHIDMKVAFQKLATVRPINTQTNNPVLIHIPFYELLHLCSHIFSVIYLSVYSGLELAIV